MPGHLFINLIFGLLVCLLVYWLDRFLSVWRHTSYFVGEMLKAVLFLQTEKSQHKKVYLELNQMVLFE